MRGVHAVFEVADAFAQSAHHFGNLLATKEQHDHRQNNNQMKRAQRFHNSPAFQTSLDAKSQLTTPWLLRIRQSDAKPSKYNTLVPGPPGNLLAVQVLQQRDGVLARDARKFLKYSDRQARA